MIDPSSEVFQKGQISGLFPLEVGNGCGSE